MEKSPVKVCGFFTDWNRPKANGKYGGVGWYRIVSPMKALGFPYVGNMTIGRIEDALKLKEMGDIWFMKPMDSDGIALLMGAASEFSGSRIILDLDDEPFNIDKKNPNYKLLKEKSLEVRKMIEMADHIVVSTEPLKKSVEKVNQKVTVIPNAIDTKIWDVKKQKRDDGIIRIGWFASGSHMADLPIVSRAMERIIEKYKNVEFYMMGIITADFGKGRVKHVEGTGGYAEFPQFLADMDLDISIAPNKENQFNDCRSNIKWMEAAMLEVPSVLSNIYPYRTSVEHGKNALIASTEEEWVTHLSFLIENPVERKKMGKEAKREVLSKWTIRKMLPKYQEVFEKVRKKDITVYTALSGNIDKLIEEQETRGADFIAYTNGDSPVWKCEKPYDKFKDNRRNSRIQKIMPHKYIDTEYSIYMDANFSLKVPAQELIDRFLKEKDIAVFKHPGRDCVYEEAEACVALRKETPEALSEQVKHYAKNRIKQHGGLCECGVIIRRHTKEVNEMNEKWWAEYCRFSKRDQVSFPVAFDLAKVNVIDEWSVTNNPFFQYHAHKNR